jgi:bleomycin hydrolase
MLKAFAVDVNAPTSALEKAVIACIKADQPVFFGSDAGAPGIRNDGIWDTKAFDYQVSHRPSLFDSPTIYLIDGVSFSAYVESLWVLARDEQGAEARDG